MFYGFSSWSATAWVVFLCLSYFCSRIGDFLLRVSSSGSCFIWCIIFDSLSVESFRYCFCGISRSRRRLDKVRFFICVISYELFLVVGILSINATGLLGKGSRNVSVSTESSFDFASVGGIEVLLVGEDAGSVGDFVSSWSPTIFIVGQNLDTFLRFSCGREGISGFEDISSDEGECFSCSEAWFWLCCGFENVCRGNPINSLPAIQRGSP